jgi:DNA-binding NtrC family response regulator
MNDNDFTRTSESASNPGNERALLCLTIVWHPDLARVGEQAVILRDTLELTRYQPVFAKPQAGRGPGSAGLASAGPDLPLGHEGISRQPILFARALDGGIGITPPASKMVLEINGVAISGHHTLSALQIEAGVVIGLARSVLLCLHTMRCIPKHNPVEGLIGVGSAAIKTRDLIRQVAATQETVLLLGETGTGKEVAARAIHALSLRRDQALVNVNMAALNEGLAAAELFGAAKGAYTGAQSTRGGFFQEAQEGTLFLDEIGNAPATVQPMLLRVLETGDYRPLGASRDVQSKARIIAATDQDLYGGGFNQALLRRLESFVIQLPPLRARREDIGLLIVHMLQTTTLPDCANLIPPAALVSEMANYDWPGNIRQLRHVVKRILLAMRAGEVPTMGELLEVPLVVAAATEATSNAAVPAKPVTHSSAGQAEPTAGERATRPHAGMPRKKPAHLSEADVLLAMQNSAWSIRGAALALGISRQSLYTLLEAHSQIRRPEHIPMPEITDELAKANGDVDACATQLKTPAEALRRYLRLQKCI